MQVVAISILGLFAQWAVVFFLCLIEAPSQLDSEKTIAHEKEIEVLAASRQSAEFALAGKTTEAQRLQWALAQKHPHDKRKEAEIEKALATLNTQEREALAWLLNAGETRRGKLQARGLNADALFENGEFPPLLAYRSERPGNGTVEMDRFYYVNPNMVDALRNVLYPPRPVAPPRV